MITLPLPNDMARCEGDNDKEVCSRRETCARYVTQNYDTRGKTYPYSYSLCLFVTGKEAVDFYIPCEPIEARTVRKE